LFRRSTRILGYTVDLHQLKMFLAVAEFGNLTQAADRLHISQSAASAQIKQLEEEFEILLFERRSSGLALTRVGSALLPAIQQLLANAAQVEAHARSLRGSVTGAIKFAAVTSIIDKAFPQFAEMTNRILRGYPMLEIELEHSHSRAIKTGIAHGEFDAGLALGNKDEPNLCRVLLQELPYHVVASEVWRNQVHGASWDELGSLPWVLCPGTHDEMAKQLFRGQRRQPEKIVRAHSQQLINNLLVAGAGLGLMPEDRAIEAQAAGNVFLIEGGRTSTHLQFLYRVGREKDPAIQAILNTLVELWPQPAKSAVANRKRR
jgi:DNA-binding transcriptional LysR family regulator